MRVAHRSLRWFGVGEGNRPDKPSGRPRLGLGWGHQSIFKRIVHASYKLAHTLRVEKAGPRSPGRIRGRQRGIGRCCAGRKRQARPFWGVGASRLALTPRQAEIIIGVRSRYIWRGWWVNPRKRVRARATWRRYHSWTLRTSRKARTRLEQALIGL